MADTFRGGREEAGSGENGMAGGTRIQSEIVIGVNRGLTSPAAAPVSWAATSAIGPTTFKSVAKLVEPHAVAVQELGQRILVGRCASV